MLKYLLGYMTLILAQNIEFAMQLSGSLVANSSVILPWEKFQYVDKTTFNAHRLSPETVD